jgi:hypothetical protein
VSEHVSWLLRAMTETSLVIDTLDKALTGIDDAHRENVRKLAGWAVHNPVAATEILVALCDGLQMRFDAEGQAPRAKLIEELKELLDDLQMRMTSPDELLPYEKEQNQREEPE